MPPIHLISTFHYDYIYLKGSREYFETSFRILDRALAMLERNPEWNFTVEQVILLEAYVEKHPEQLPSLRRFAAEGRLCFAPGMYVMPDMNLIDGESLFLQAKYGKAWLRDRLGVEPESCWIADCWGHHAQLPQILAQSGYKGYFFWRCMRRDVARNDFIWVGLDGTPLSAHWLAKGYAGLCFPERPGAERTHAEELAFTESSVAEVRRLVADLNAYGNDAPFLICNGGDFRVPQESACEIVDGLNRTGELPPIHFSSPDAFLRACDPERLPRVGGEFNVAFQGTCSANIRIKQLLYENRERLLAQESLAALGKHADVPEQQWKRLLAHQFHDTICGTVCDDGLHEIISDLEALRTELTVPGAPAAWFNPTLHPRREIVPGADGRRHWVEFAPLSCRTPEAYPALPELEPVSGAGEFRNDFFHCRYDGGGRLVSLKTPRGRELIDPANPAWFGLPVMQIDNGDNWMLYDAPLDGGCDAAAFASNLPDPLFREPAASGLINRNPFFARIHRTRINTSEAICEIVQQGNVSFWRMDIAFTLTVTLSADSPLIRFRLEILPAGKHYRLRAAFPTTLKQGAVRHGIPFGIAERGNTEYPAEGFCHLGAADCGLFLLNRGIPGNNIDENGVMMLSLFRAAAMEYKCDSDGSFQEGVPHTFEYAVLPHDGAAALPGEAVEGYLRPPQPMAAETFADQEWGALPANVRLSALRKNPAGIFMRIYECCGAETALTLALPKFVRAVRDADGLERPLATVRAAADHRLTLTLRPFEIRNLILEK